MKEIEPETIIQCQKGNAAAFAEVVNRYERPLFAFIFRMGFTPPAREPEDVVQEIFLKVYQSIQGFASKRGASFSTWLFAIARNHCVSLMRRKQLEDKIIDIDHRKSARMTDQNSLNPRQAVSRKEEARHVAHAIEQLSEKMRTTLVLRYYHDMPCTEIAQILQCDEGTVRSRLARARQYLKDQLLTPSKPREEIQP